MKKEIRDEFIRALMSVEYMDLDCTVEGEDPPMPGLLPAMRNFFDAYKADLQIVESLRKQSAEYSASNVELAHQVSELEDKNEALAHQVSELEDKNEALAHQVSKLTKEVQMLGRLHRPGQVKVDPYTVPEDPDAWRNVRDVPEGWSELPKEEPLLEGDIFWSIAWREWCDNGNWVETPHDKCAGTYYRKDVNPDAWRKVRRLPEGWSTLDEGALLKEGDVFWAKGGADLWCDITHITIGNLVLYRHIYYRRDDRS